MSDGSSRSTVVGGGGRKPITAADVAAQTGGRLVGDPAVVIRGVAPLDRAAPDELGFLSHRRYAEWFATTRAGVVIVGESLANATAPACTLVFVEKPADAMLGVLAMFRREEPRVTGVHPRAVLADDVVVGDGVSVEAGAVVADGVVLGDRCWIGANATIGAGTRIGADARVHPNASVHAWCEIGDRVVIHSGASIGREGFGYVPTERGIARIPHIGRCVLEHDVDIGANSCIDRGSVDDTIIGAGTKIDNLVHVAHNVRIGRMCLIASGVGIAGSTRIGDGVQFGGQAGINGHITIGSRATIAGQAGVFGDVPAGETWSGYPARPHREQLRAAAALVRLGRLIRPLERLLSREDAS